jgi:hypothetical protein
MGRVRICKRGHEVRDRRACKECQKVADFSYRLRNPGANAKKARESRKRNPARSLLWSAKARALRENLPFDLEESDTAVPNLCPVLGIPLLFADRGRSDNTPSVDRLDPTLGYVKGNIAVISWRANRMKARFDLHEFEALVRWWNLKQMVQGG